MTVWLNIDEKFEREKNIKRGGRGFYAYFRNRFFFMASHSKSLMTTESLE